jgi:hypothetical protein
VSDVTGSPASFGPGAFVCTPGALELLSHRDLQELLRRHLSGDWGGLGTTYEGSGHYGG